MNVTVSKKQTYTVTTIDANGCLDTASVEIKVEPEVTVSNDTAICHGATPRQWAHLTFQCDNFSNLLWKDLRTDTSSNLQDWYVSPEETTRYALSVSSTRADGTVCTAHDTVTVYVNDTVTPVITIHRVGYPTTDTTVVPECGNMEARFIAATPFGGQHPRYQWTINGRDIPGATDSVFTTHDLTNFCYVRCRLISDEPCPTADEVLSNIIIVKIIEKNRVMIDINANTGTDICADDTVMFYMSTAYEGENPVYQWYLNDRAISDLDGGKDRTWIRFPLKTGYKDTSLNNYVFLHSPDS